MYTEEMARAAQQERNQEIANIQREAEWRKFLSETDATSSPSRNWTWQTFIPNIKVAGIRQFVGALGRA